MKRKFSFAEKAQILKETALPGCSISDVAKIHNISRCTIYAWLRESRALQASDAEIASKINSNFVEVTLIDSKIMETKNCLLQKASFTFDDFTFSIEGDLNKQKLQKVIRVLEDIC